MMTFNRVSPVCLFLCLAVLVETAAAQTPASGGYVGDTTGFATAGDFSGSYLFGNDGGTYFLIDKMVGDGPGYDTGYTRLGLRVKLHEFGDSHLWGSGYALITDDTRVGVNVGGGYRCLFDSNIVSLHGWWDSYETNNGNRYNQVTAGFELLHEEVDLRVNGYYPLGNTESFLGVTDPGIVSVFTSRGIGFLGHGLDEQALKGIDAEVGTAIFAVNWARVYAGGYWYEGKDTNFGGGRGRIEAAISPDLSLNFMVQNDTEFNTNYNVSVEYRFSGGISPGLCTPFHGETRKYNPVRRQWPIATHVVEIPTIVPMLNPKTGGIVTAAFVDNRNPDAGDGSFQNPFRELPSMVNADKIFVFAGSGPTEGNITLKPNQHLLGEGKLYTFEDSLRGTVTVPAVFSSIGPRPELVAGDPTMNIITLSNWNRVANFDITGPTPAAIAGTGITDFTIEMVTATGVTDGVHIDNASGLGSIRDSRFDVSDQGIFVSNTGGARLNLAIERNVGGLTTLGGREGIHVAASGGDVNLVMNGIRVNNATESGIILDAALGSRLTADVNEARVLNSGGVAGEGFRLNVMSGGSMAVELTNISARGNDDLFVVDVQDGDFIGTVAGGVPGVLAGADFSDSATGSGVRLNLEDATGRLTFSSLFANRNAVNGIEADAAGDGTNFLLEVMDSRLMANFGSGMSIDIMDGADFRHFVDPTFVTLNGGSGLEFDVRDPGSVYIADVFQTDFSDSTLHAIDGNVFNGAFANVDFTQILGISAGQNGYNLVVDQNSDFIGTVTNANFTAAGDGSVDLSVSDGSTLSLTMSEIEGHNNGDFGLRFLAADGVNGPSDLFLAVTNGDFNSNPDSNIIGTAQGAGSRASVYFNDVTADDAAVDGSVVLSAEDGGIINTHWTTGSISQGDGDGILAMVDGPGSQIRLHLTGVSINTNARDGIDGTLTGGGPGSLLNISLVNSSVSQNGINGIDLSLDGPGARGQLTIDNTPVGGNFFGDGLEFDVTGGAGLLASAFGTSTHFASNGGRAWDGSVSGAGSFATLNVDGADAFGEGLEGGLFEVGGGGLLNLILANLMIAENPLDGLLTTVTGPGSRANIVMDQILMRRNGISLVGDAFEARASMGGAINATLSNMMVVQNREDAFLYDASTGGMITTRMDNIFADNNGRHGLEFHATSGGSFDGIVNASSFSNEGGVFIADGVLGTASGLGSTASIFLNEVLADNNSRMGFEFDVSGGASLLAAIRSGGLFGNSSGSGNALNGVRFNATDAGPTMGFLLMSGPNIFDGNGADGVNVDAVDVNMMVTQLSGNFNNNGADGINIRYDGVASGAISIEGNGVGTVTGNVDDGIEVSVNDSSLIEKTVAGVTVPSLLIDGLTIENNGDDNLIVTITNSDVEDGQITNNIINGGPDGINVHLGAGNSNMLIDSNTISDVNRYGIVVTSDAGTHNLKITNNTVTSSGDTNIFTDIFGTSQTGLMINDNTIVGGGLGAAMFTVGTNFTGMTFTQSILLGTASIPPDTMGAVGPNHIVEFVNQGVTIYNKNGTVAVPTISLDQFWLNAGLPDVAQGTFDPRIIFDPTVGRWFVAAIDSVATGGNNIYIGVSNTADPTQGFVGLRFVGDSVDNARFNDFETLGLDADGVYLATNNFGGPNGFDVSIFSIPKVDLLGAVPTVANLSRFEGLDSTMFGETPQPAVDFGPSDGLAQFVGTLFPGGSSVQRVDVVGAGTPTAAIGTPVNVATPFYFIGPGGRQPNPFLLPLEPPSPRFSGNVIEIGDSLWAVQDVQGSFASNSAVRWYEIDSVTNTVLQTGLIEAPNLDFIASSINVNAAGAVMIGFTGTGPGQFASSMATFGTTDAMGTTTFQTPVVLQPGVANYEIDFGTGRNRWGDYSATVIDPVNPNTFWTFQELVVGPDDFGVQITEVTFSQAVLGGTVNDGIRVEVRDNAHLTDSMINGNSSSNNGDDGIEVSVSDLANVDSLTINGNISSNNGGDGIRYETLNTGTRLGGLTISSNTDVSNNSDDGIEVILNGLHPSRVPDINVNGNIVQDNLDRGIRVSAVDSSLDDVSISMNTVTDNLGGHGIELDILNPLPGVVTTDSILMMMNTVSGSSGDGVNIDLTNITGLDSVRLLMNDITDNMGGGIALTALATPIDLIQVSGSVISSNTAGDGVLLDLTDGAVDRVLISANEITNNTGNGINLDLTNSPINDLRIIDHAGGGGGPMISGADVIFTVGTSANNQSIQNTSMPGIDLTQFVLDMNAPDIYFDTEEPGASFPFDPDSGVVGDTATTGLVSINGQMIMPGVVPLQDLGGNPLPGGGIPDNSQVATFVFSDFNPGETFDYFVDTDYEPSLASGPFGIDLAIPADATATGPGVVTVDFSNGQQLMGFMAPDPNNPFGSVFQPMVAAAAPGVSNNLGDGIRISATAGSNIGNFVIDNNSISANLVHGIEFLIQDSTLPTGGLGSTGLISNNTITDHDNGDGVRLLNPDTNATPFQIDFVDNTISSNGAATEGVGINISLDANSGGMTSTLTGNEISSNASKGLSVIVQDNATLDLTVGDSTANQNVFSGNADAGIAVETRDASVSNIAVVNTMVNSTVNGPDGAYNGEGFALHSNGTSLVETLTIGDPILANTSFGGNAANGIEIDIAENHRNPNLLIQNVTANSNGENGISITRNGFASLSEDLNANGAIDPGEDVNGDGMLGHAVITRTTATGNTGNGLDVTISGSQLPIQQLDVNRSTFMANTIGVDFVVNNDASLLTNFANNTVSMNRSHGVSVTTNQNSAFGNVFPSGGDANSPLAVASTFSSNIVSRNAGNGFNFVANNLSKQVIDIDDAGAVNPATGTSRTVMNSNAGHQVQIMGNGTSQQNIDLTAVTMTNSLNVATGNGVNIDANGTSTVDVSISGGASGPSIIGQLIATPGVGFANGVLADVSGNAILNLDMTDVNVFGNTGDAINIRNSGPQTTGNQLGGSGERQTIQATFDNVDARFNGDQGFDVVLDGNIGGRAAQGDTDVPVLIDIMNSNFSSNANEGIFFRAAPGFTHGGNNFYADMIVTFNVLDSMIQSNGSTSITDGLVMEIGTNAYVLGDVSGNMFGANGNDDFHTNSFDSGAQANTAALDLAFQGNSGDHIRPTALGTVVGSTFFILDQALTVEPNNDFQLFGVPQMEVFGPDGFFTNGYILRFGPNHGDPTFPP